MRFLKFSLLSLLTISTFSFSATECFNSSFDVKISHKSFPFGLLNKTLSIKKTECEITISHNEYKYLNSKWIVDICRNPIHVKVASSSVDVLRKTQSCTTVKSDFCKEYGRIVKIIEDDGLIFAPGLKSNLEADHGKVYCSYFLIKEYVAKERIFNIGNDYDYLLKKESENGKTIIDQESDFRVDPESGRAEF